VSKQNVIKGESFSISVNSFCPIGLPGKCLIECKIVDPDGNFTYLDTWSRSGLTILPGVSCYKLGNYIVDYCGVYTDFIANRGWGSKDDTNTIVDCISSPDIEPPTYSNDNDNSGGSLIEGTMVNSYVKWQDNVRLSKSLLKTNITGSWQTYAYCSLSGNSSWCNKTISTAGFLGKICWNQWANDTSGNLNNTMLVNVHCFNVIELPDNKPPTYVGDSDSSGGFVEEGEKLVNISTLWNDNKCLSSASIMHNETGTWAVDSTALTGTSKWYNYTIDTTNYQGKTVCWYQDATDTSGNTNNTMPNHCFNIFSSTQTSQPNPIESLFEPIVNSMRVSSADTSTRFATLIFQFLGIIALTIMLIILVESVMEAK
jgi:hypothetical protein